MNKQIVEISDFLEKNLIHLENRNANFLNHFSNFLKKFLLCFFFLQNF